MPGCPAAQPSGHTRMRDFSRTCERKGLSGVSFSEVLRFPKHPFPRCDLWMVSKKIQANNDFSSHSSFYASSKHYLGDFFKTLCQLLSLNGVLWSPNVFSISPPETLWVSARLHRSYTNPHHFQSIISWKETCVGVRQELTQTSTTACTAGSPAPKDFAQGACERCPRAHGGLVGPQVCRGTLLLDSSTRMKGIWPWVSAFGSAGPLVRGTGNHCFAQNERPEL